MMLALLIVLAMIVKIIVEKILFEKIGFEEPTTEPERWWWLPSYSAGVIITCVGGTLWTVLLVGIAWTITNKLLYKRIGFVPPKIFFWGGALYDLPSFFFGAAVGIIIVVF